MSSALRLSAQRALLGAVFPQLRAVHVSDNGASWQVHFIFDGAICDDERDLLTTAGAEIAADLPHGFAYDEKVERIDAPAKVALPARWQAVFARAEQPA